MSNFFSVLLDGIKEKGIVPSDDQALAEDLLQYINALPSTIPSINALNIALIFTYDQAEQPEQYRDYLGMAFRQDTISGRPAFCIGISHKAIMQGQDAAMETYLHEAAHATHGDVYDHGHRFKRIWDEYVRRYYAAKGSVSSEQAETKNEGEETLSPARKRARQIINEYKTRTGRFAGLPAEERTDAPPTSEPTFKPTFPGTYQGTFSPTYPELTKGPERAAKIKE